MQLVQDCYTKGKKESSYYAILIVKKLIHLISLLEEKINVTHFKCV